MNKKGKLPKTVIIYALAAVILFLYVSGALKHLKHVNHGGTDQGTYMQYAKEIRVSGYTYIGNRHQMPVYPLIQSIFYRKSMTDKEFFIIGKLVNVLQSVFILVTVFFILKKYFPFSHASAVILIISFSVFIFKAAFFQCTLLFYFLKFCCFLLIYENLRKPSSARGMAVGIMLAIAYLTKASILPLLYMYVITVVLQLFLSNNARKAVISMIIAVICFITVLVPYMKNNKRLYGRYLFNINTTYYMWYESWKSAEVNQGIDSDRRQLPPEMQPTAFNYMKKHSFRHILHRIFYMMYKLALEYTRSYGYMKYAAIYVMAVFIVLFLGKKYVLKILKENTVIAVYFILFFGGYMILYSWYAPIASGNRFMLSLFIPFLFVSSLVLTKFRINRMLVMKNKPVNIDWLFCVLIYTVLVFDIYDVMTARILLIYGGA